MVAYSDLAGDLAQVDYLQRRLVGVGDQGQDLTDIGRRKQHRVREILGGHVEQMPTPTTVSLPLGCIIRYIVILHENSQSRCTQYGLIRLPRNLAIKIGRAGSRIIRKTPTFVIGF
jgi:hypothetical protein